MSAGTTCPKCDGRITERFLMNDAHGNHAAVRWYEGAPVHSLRTGVKVTGLAIYRVSTYRCGRCRLLESYALSR